MINHFFGALRSSFAPRHITRLVRKPALVLFISGLLTNVISIFTALFTLLVYDKVYPHDGLSTLLVLTVGVLALLVIDLSLKFLRTAAINRALYGDVAIDARDRRTEFQIFSRVVNRLDSDSYLKRSIDELAQSKPSDVRTASLVVDLPFILVLLLAIYFIAGDLVWIPIVAATFLMIFVGWNYGRSRKASQELEKAKKSAIESFAFISRGGDWLYGLGAWNWLKERELNIKHDIANKSATVAQLSGTKQTIYQTVVQLVSVSTVFFGFFLYQDGLIGFGGIIATYLLANRALSPIGNIVQMGALEDSVAEDKPVQENQDAVSDINVSNDTWNLSLRDVCFTYEGQTSTSLSIDKLDIKSDEKIAIVGRSGSGKSTFGKLLMQMLKGTEGTITWNGIPINSINPQHWSEQCIYIPQTPWLGQGSLFEQIRLGDDRISDEDIATAVTQSGLTEILSLNQSSITADTLSAGQLQAIGLVRCLVRKAPLLILDEPTNFLDEETEKALVSAILKRYEGSTILIITHKQSLIGLMQRALVFNKGSLVKDGQIVRETK